MLDTDSTAIVSLASILPGQEVEIVRVLLAETGRNDRHLSPGRRWRCRFNGSASMLLDNRTGSTISVPGDVARFIEVRRTTA
jgi:hypothetical protein